MAVSDTAKKNPLEFKGSTEEILNYYYATEDVFNDAKLRHFTPWAEIERRKGNLVPHITAAQITALRNFLDAMLDKALGSEGYYGVFGTHYYISGDNFGTHVIAGFWKWLFQGLTKLGVTIPADFSLGSLVKLALEIMGHASQLDEDDGIWEGYWQYQQLRSRGNTIEAGTSEILRNIIAERVLGLPKLR